MAAKRALFLGATGTAQSQALVRLRDWYAQRGMKWAAVNFEAEYLWGGQDAVTSRLDFLDSSIGDQAKCWSKAWGNLVKDLPNLEAENAGIFLGIHGCYTRSHFGARSVLNSAAVAAQFRPEIIFTLIADLYEMWWRTELRAQGNQREGMPTLEQHLFGRRLELVVGDQIALESGGRVKNLVVGVNHPFETVANAVNHPANHSVVYLSFPISQPREQEALKNPAPKQAVETFLKAAYARQTNKPLVLICPLAIDEIPFAKSLPNEPLEAIRKDVASGELQRTINFSPNDKRWNLDNVWLPKDRLVEPLISGPDFPLAQLLNAAGGIISDVSWRDYRLVDQADYLLVFNPIFCGRDEAAKSVRLEVDHARSQRKSVYLFQDREHDPHDIISRTFALTSATMVSNPFTNLIHRRDSLDRLLDAL